MWAALGAKRACRSRTRTACYPLALLLRRELSSVATSLASSSTTPPPTPPASTTKLALPTLADLYLNEGDNVVVAVSGGVDSSVTLRLLSELPLNLSVLFMRNWDPILSEDKPDGDMSLAYNEGATHSPCSWERDWSDVRRVAKHVGIPDDKISLVDLSSEYWTRVFEPSVAEWDAGRTPNPDVWCNREIKFGALLKHIPDGHFLATGHYARVKREGGRATLHRAIDENKDQTYYLSQVTEASLSRAVFPLAGIPKPRVRELARQFDLPTAERKESMGVCFIGERGKFSDFVAQYVSTPTTGWFITPEGERVQEHRGLSFYTIGQKPRLDRLKKGMQGRWFIAEKGVGETGSDILIVPTPDHPALLCNGLWSSDFNWIAGEPCNDMEVLAQVRHRMAPEPAYVRVDSQRGIRVMFPRPIPAVATGQVVGLWDGDKCLGSGVIDGCVTVSGPYIAPPPQPEPPAPARKQKRPVHKHSAPRHKKVLAQAFESTERD